MQRGYVSRLCMAGSMGKVHFLVAKQVTSSRQQMLVGVSYMY